MITIEVCCRTQRGTQSWTPLTRDGKQLQFATAEEAAAELHQHLRALVAQGFLEVVGFRTLGEQHRGQGRALF